MEPWSPPLLLSCLFCVSWFICMQANGFRFVCWEDPRKPLDCYVLKDLVAESVETGAKEEQRGNILHQWQTCSRLQWFAEHSWWVWSSSISLKILCCRSPLLLELISSSCVPPWSRGRSWLSSINIFLWRAAAPGTGERPSPNVNDEQLARAMQERQQVESRPTSENNHPPQHVPGAVPRHACIWLAFEL